MTSQRDRTQEERLAIIETALIGIDGEGGIVTDVKSIRADNVRDRREASEARRRFYERFDALVQDVKAADRKADRAQTWSKATLGVPVALGAIAGLIAWLRGHFGS